MDNISFDGTHLGFVVEVEENVRSFDVPVDDSRMTCISKQTQTELLSEADWEQNSWPLLIVVADFLWLYFIRV